MEVLNPYYQKIADHLLDILSTSKWEKIIYKVVFYLPDEFGHVLSSEKVFSYFDGKQQMHFSSDDLSSEMEEFRSKFGESQNICWTTMVFEITSTGDLDVDLGYEEIIYDGQ